MAKIYEPYPCEICKMLLHTPLLWTEYDRVECRKYEIKERICTTEINDPGYQWLHSKCNCKKCYPSKFKILMFKLERYFRIKSDKKYHRYED